MEVLKVENLLRTYKMGLVDVPALKGISFGVQKGEFVSIMGASGCGKSTLMNLIGCLDKPSGGKVWLDGVDVSSLDDNELAEIRNKKVGFVFQMFNLLPRLSALENVELPLIYSGMINGAREKRAETILAEIGLSGRIHHFPRQMSGGEMQRVAIGRALINNPSIVLADEPTGNLDTKSSQEIIAVFQKINAQGVTIMMVTHEPDIAQYTKRIIRMLDGKIIEDKNIDQVMLEANP